MLKALRWEESLSAGAVNRKAGEEGPLESVTEHEMSVEIIRSVARTVSPSPHAQRWHIQLKRQLVLQHKLNEFPSPYAIQGSVAPKKLSLHKHPVSSFQAWLVHPEYKSLKS